MKITTMQTLLPVLVYYMILVGRPHYLKNKEHLLQFFHQNSIKQKFLF